MSSNAAQFTIVISALDKATATMRHINQSVNANLVMPFANVGRSIAALAEETGVVKLGEAAVNAGRKFGELGSRISSVVGPLAALGAAASAAGLFELAKGAGDWGEQLQLASIKTGWAADSLAKLHYVAERNQLSIEQMDKALFRLNLTIGDAASGKNKNAAAMFHALGISLRDSHRHVRDGAALWADLSEAMAKNKSATMRAQIASTLFGARMGGDLIPVMAKGGGEMRKLFGEFEGFYGKITPQTLKALDEGHDAFERLSGATKGLKFTIGAALIPVLSDLIAPLTNMVAANRKLIATNVHNWAVGVADALKRVDWASVARGAEAFGSAIGKVFSMLGPFWSSIAVAGIVFSPFIFAALGAATALLKLGWAMGEFAVKVAMFVVGGGLPSLMLRMAMLTSTVLPGLSAAFLSLGAAIEATPIGWIITGIAAVAGAAYLLYEYWTPITAFFSGLWQGVISTFKWAWDNIVPAIPGLSAVKMLVGHWRDVPKFFSMLWKSASSAFTWAKNFIIGATDYTVQAVTDAWGPVANFFSGVWSGVKDAFRWGWDNIAPWVPGLNLVKLVIDNWKPITVFFQRLWDGVTGVFEHMWERLKPIIETVVGGAKWLAEHTGLLEAAHIAAQVTHTVVHKVVQVAGDTGQWFQHIEEHGAALSRLGNVSKLADLISKGEGGYNSVNLGARGGYRAATLPLGDMTLGDVMAAQTKHQFNAAGRYQIIATTLKAAVAALHLNLKEKFAPAMQDRIFKQFLIGTKNPEIAKYLTGRSSDVMAAALAASREWASVANPKTGKSYYAGIANNRASISAAQMVQALQAARADSDAPRIPASSRPVVNPRILSTPIITGRGQAAVAAANGKVHVQVDLSGAPAGTRVSAKGTGPAVGNVDTNLNRGRSWID